MRRTTNGTHQADRKEVCPPNRNTLHGAQMPPWMAPPNKRPHTPGRSSFTSSSAWRSSSPPPAGPTETAGVGIHRGGGQFIGRRGGGRRAQMTHLNRRLKHHGSAKRFHTHTGCRLEAKLSQHAWEHFQVIPITSNKSSPQQVGMQTDARQKYSKPPSVGLWHHPGMCKPPP